MLNVNDLNQIYLGCQGENLARTIVIDVKPWLVAHPNGVISLYHKRNGAEEATPTGAEFDAEAGTLTWRPTSTDTYMFGEGEAEIRLAEGSVIKKSRKIKTDVAKAVTGGDGTALESGWQGYIDAIQKAAGVAITKNGQIKFAVNSNGHLIFSYTEQVPVPADDDDTETTVGDITWIDKDLGTVSAFGVARENGWTGTEALWTALQAACPELALKAESFGAGTRNGDDLEEGDPAYNNNAPYYAGLAADSAEDAADSAGDAADSATAAAASAEDAAQYTHDAVHTWLENNIDPASDYALDRTLTEPLAAAPADMVGSLKSALVYDGEIINHIGTAVNLELIAGKKFNTSTGVVENGAYCLTTKFYNLDDVEIDGKIHVYLEKASGGANIHIIAYYYYSNAESSFIENSGGYIDQGDNYFTNVPASAKFVRFLINKVDFSTTTLTDISKAIIYRYCSIENETNDVKEYVLISDEMPLSFVAGKTIDSSGKYVSGNYCATPSFYSLDIPKIVGTLNIVLEKQTSGADIQIGVFFYSSASEESGSFLSRTPNYLYGNLSFDIPEGANYVRFTVTRASYEVTTLSDIKKAITYKYYKPASSADTQKIFNSINIKNDVNLDFTRGSSISDGVFGANGNYCVTYGFYPLNDAVVDGKINVTLIKKSGGSNLQIAAIWYSSGSESGYIDRTTYNTNQEAVFDVPSSAKYARFIVTRTDFSRTFISDIESAVLHEYPEVKSAVHKTKYDVPEYYKEQVDNAIMTARNNMFDAGSHGDSFIFISDLHWEVNAKTAPALVKKIADELTINKIMCCGDLIKGEDDVSAKRNMSEVVCGFKDITDFYCLFGNHDTNYYKYASSIITDVDQTTWTKENAYALMQKQMERYKSFNIGDLCYFYFDNDAIKTRYICIDTGVQQAISADQFSWISDTLASTPDDYHIIVFSHILYEAANTWFIGMTTSDLIQYTSTGSLYTLLDNFNTQDPSELKGRKIEAVFAGHVHFDCDFITSGGIPVILIDTNGMQTWEAKPDTNPAVANSEFGTITEQAFDIVTIDYTAKTIKCVRIGRGSDRTFSYGS